MSRLFTEELQDNECLVITGAEQVSSYRGSSATFEWAGTYNDKSTHDRWGRKETQIVAMDALHLRRNQSSQFKPGLMRREANKAYCGFITFYVDSPRQWPRVTRDVGHAVVTHTSRLCYSGSRPLSLVETSSTLRVETSTSKKTCTLHTRSWLINKSALELCGRH